MIKAPRIHAPMLQLSPLDPDFVQDPYALYAKIRAQHPVVFWDDYGMLAAFDHTTVYSLLRDKRLGREVPASQRKDPPVHLIPFYAIEKHSILELEPPRHTRLRRLVLRAFTSRRIAGLGPEINDIAHDQLDQLCDGDDLIPKFCQPIPVRVIARLLGVPEGMAPDLLRWSTAMVEMYQSNRTRQTEQDAASAATEFADFLRQYVETRRHDPRDDLITHLIAAEQDGETLTLDELISTCILLLNAGHEATVHTIGNAVKCLLEQETDHASLAPDRIEGTVEEILRFDPSLHVFTRYAYEDVSLGQHVLRAGEQVALVLGAANRDPKIWNDAQVFNPDRAPRPHTAFGGGLHFCVGAPLARLELKIVLSALFQAFPQLSLSETPRYANSYHFHKLDRLIVGL